MVQCTRCFCIINSSDEIAIHHENEEGETEIYCTNCFNYVDNDDDDPIMIKPNIYKPIEIKKIRIEFMGEECCICLDEKVVIQGIFKCKHTVCSDCYRKLNKVICPLCRSDAVKPIYHPISELIIDFYKCNHQYYPWEMKTTYKKTNKSPFVYFAFKRLKNI